MISIWIPDTSANWSKLELAPKPPESLITDIAMTM
jgi:hypothetical protein